MLPATSGISLAGIVHVKLLSAHGVPRVTRLSRFGKVAFGILGAQKRRKRLHSDECSFLWGLLTADS